VKLLDVVFPDRLFKGIPLGLGSRCVHASDPVASERHRCRSFDESRTGRKDKGESGFSAGSFHPSGRKNYFLNIIIDRIIQAIFAGHVRQREFLPRTVSPVLRPVFVNFLPFPAFPDIASCLAKQRFF
jgi:hypothetical protein